jgi:phage shock protein C
VGPDAVNQFPAHACCINYYAVRGKKMMESIQEAFQRQGLVRVRDDRVLGGVIAGLARRFGLEPWPARLLFVLVLMLIPGSQLLIYPILWILMPEASDRRVSR